MFSNDGRMAKPVDLPTERVLVGSDVIVAPPTQIFVVFVFAEAKLSGKKTQNFAPCKNFALYGTNFTLLSVNEIMIMVSS